MLNTIRKQIHGALIFLGGVTAHHYVGRILDQRNIRLENIAQEARDKQMDNVQSTVNETKDMVRSLYKRAEDLQQIPVQSGTELDRDLVNANLESIKSHCSTMSNVTNSEYLSTEAQNKLVESSNQINSCVEEIHKLIANSGNKNFNSWLNQYYDFLNSLSLHQESAFINILLFLLLMLTILNILAIFFGNEIIKYFNLESKFPSLASFFKLRTKFQKYYLLWNIFIFFVVCFIGIFINIIIFI